MRLKIQIFILTASIAFAIYSCKANKNTKEPTASLKPGEAELAAVKAKYPDATAEQLDEGFRIYSGPCTECHKKRNIYSHSEEEWKKWIDKMAPKAKLTAEQKDHLTKYVFSMKASHPNKTK